MHSLEEYPSIIEKAQLEQDDLWAEHFAAQQAVDRYESRFEDEAAKDKSLTNATMRKAHVQERKSVHDGYNVVLNAATNAKRDAVRKGFEIERLIREFEVAKIYKRVGEWV